MLHLSQVHIFASLALFSDGVPSFPQKKCMRVNKTHMHEYSSSFQRFTWMWMHNLPLIPFTKPAKTPGCGDQKMIRIFLQCSHPHIQHIIFCMVLPPLSF